MDAHEIVRCAAGLGATRTDVTNMAPGCFWVFTDLGPRERGILAAELHAKLPQCVGFSVVYSCAGASRVLPGGAPTPAAVGMFGFYPAIWHGLSDPERDGTYGAATQQKPSKAPAVRDSRGWPICQQCETPSEYAEPDADNCYTCCSCKSYSEMFG